MNIAIEIAIASGTIENTTIKVLAGGQVAADCQSWVNCISKCK